jgi:hypothetical protein
MTFIINPYVFAAAAPSISTPSDLASVWEWWEPSRNGFSDNDAIGTMPGQVSPGSGHNWTQSSASLKPTYKANIVNGLGVARFDGSDDTLANVNWTALTSVHFFAVLKIDNDPPATNKNGIWSIGGNNTALYPSGSTDIAEVAFRASGLRTFSKSGMSLATWRVVEVVSNSSEWIYRLDGTQLDSTTGANFGHQSSTFIMLGRSNAFDPEFLDGDFAGMYVFNAKLSSGDRTAMINYLNSRFGLSTS